MIIRLFKILIILDEQTEHITVFGLSDMKKRSDTAAAVKMETFMHHFP